VRHPRLLLGVSAVLDKTSFVNVDPERRLIEPDCSRADATKRTDCAGPLERHASQYGSICETSAQYALKIPLKQGARLVASDSNHHWLELCLLAAERF
jgi:hypothetical protein